MAEDLPDLTLEQQLTAGQVWHAIDGSNNVWLVDKNGPIQCLGEYVASKDPLNLIPRLTDDR